MKELLDKFYAGTATPEEEAQLLRSANSLPEGPDKELLQALAAMQRRGAISRMIDEAAAAESTPKRRILWPYWVGALAVAACILLLVLPREAAPVQMAENKQPTELRRPRLSTDDGHPARPTPQPVAGAGKMPAILGQAGSQTSQPTSPDIIEEEELPVIPDTPDPDLLYAEALPEPADSQFSIFNSQWDDELIILSTPSLIAREYSTTLIADATPATTNAPLPTHHTSLSVSFFGQTLGDPEADPFAQRSLFAN